MFSWMIKFEEVYLLPMVPRRSLNIIPEIQTFLDPILKLFL